MGQDFGMGRAGFQAGDLQTPPVTHPPHRAAPNSPEGGDEAQPIHVTWGQRGFQSSSRRGQSHENNTHFVNTELRAAAVGL